MRNTYFASSVEELSGIAKALLEKYPEKRIFAFFGEMGAGKTTLIKKISEALDVQDNVSSPTFALINEYHTSRDEPVYHFDFYRLKNISEALDLGYEDYFYSGNYCLIEWPGLIETLLPDGTVKVEINVDEKTGQRALIF